MFSSAAPQRTAYSEVPSQMAAHLRTAVHCRLGRLLDLNPGLEFCNLVSLPMSHHCSLILELYSSYFNLYPYFIYNNHPESINIIQQTVPSLSQYRKREPYYHHRHRGISRTVFSIQVKQTARQYHLHIFYLQREKQRNVTECLGRWFLPIQGESPI